MFNKLKETIFHKTKSKEKEDSTIFSLLNRISEKSGGVTKSVIYRSNSLQQAGHDCFILLLEFDSSIPKTISNMKSDGRIYDKVKIRSFFSHYACISLGKGEITYDAKITRTFDHIGATGMCSVRYYNEKNEIFAEELLDSNRKNIFFTLFLDGITLNFNSKVEAQTKWIDELCEQHSFVNLFSDQTNAPERIGNVSAKNVKKILQIHGNHYEPPYKKGAKVKVGYMKMFSLFNKYDEVFVLTESQKNDILNETDELTPIRVIPHPISHPEKSPVVREQNLAVVVSRIEKLKGIERIITNFKKITEHFPDASLEIWGDGNHMDAVKAHISSINAGDSVRVMGFSTNPSIPMSRASVSLFASEQEGFGLSLAESVSLGTPVVSTRTSYGAEDIIVDGVNGWIVDSDEEYIKKVVQLLDVTRNGNFNHKECISSIEWLSPDNYLARVENSLSSQSEKTIANINSMSHKFKNDRSSIKGHVYVKKENLSSVNFNKIRVLNVNRAQQFHGESCWLGLGEFEVHNLRPEGNDYYTFQIKQGHVIYSGSLPGGSVQFEIH